MSSKYYNNDTGAVSGFSNANAGSGGGFGGGGGGSIPDIGSAINNSPVDKAINAAGRGAWGWMKGAAGGIGGGPAGMLTGGVEGAIQGIRGSGTAPIKSGIGGRSGPAVPKAGVALDEYNQQNFDKTGMSAKQISDTMTGRGWVIGARKTAAEDTGVKWSGSAQQRTSGQRLPGDSNYQKARDIPTGPVGGRLQSGNVTDKPLMKPGTAKPQTYPQNFMGPVPNNAARAQPISGSGKTTAQPDKAQQLQARANPSRQAQAGLKSPAAMNPAAKAKAASGGGGSAGNSTRASAKVKTKSGGGGGAW